MLHYFCCIFYESLLMPFIFRNLILVYYLNSNFQPFPTVNTIGHIWTWAIVLAQKKIGVIQRGDKPLNWGGNAHCCPDIEPLLLRGAFGALTVIEFTISSMRITIKLDILVSSITIKFFSLHLALGGGVIDPPGGSIGL